MSIDDRCPTIAPLATRCLMLVVSDRLIIPDAELRFDFARSGGPGGQNVNKVASKAILRWNPKSSPSLPDDLRARVIEALGNRLTGEGDLLITSQRTRDQSRNVEDCLDKLRLMILDATRPRIARRATRPTLASRKRRLEAKSHRSRTKTLRKAPPSD